MKTQGRHLETIFRLNSLEVFQRNTYSDTEEDKMDFIANNFEQKFNVVFCSHVIEHQSNVGSFFWIRFLK